MTTPADLLQLLEAVRLRPGAPAYALLAERYLEADRVAEALEVCRAGFNANPSYERGAIVYLRALRRQGDVSTAREVFERSIAMHASSCGLRVVWAQLLADSGNESEARVRAREAVELDPMSREARVLLAGLRGTPPPALRRTGGPGLAGMVFGTPEAEAAGSGTPPGLTFSTISLPGRQDAPSSIVADDPSRALANVGPARVAAPVHERFDVTPGPPPSEPLFPDPTTHAAGEPRATVAAAPSHALGGAGPAADAPAAHDEPIQPKGPSQQLETVLPPDAARRDRPRRRVNRWVALATFVAFAGVAAGMLLQRQRRELAEKEAAGHLAQLMALTSRDTASDYLATLTALDALIARHPRSTAARAARALISAHLAFRLGSAERNVEERAAALIHQARTAAPNLSWTLIARALRAWHMGEPTGALALLDKVAPENHDWHYHLARGLALESKLELDRAETQFTYGLDAQGSLALLVEGARLARLRNGDIAPYLRAGIAARRGDHAPLQLQAALFAAERGKMPKPKALLQLERLSATSARQRAHAALLRAYVLRGQRKVARAVATLKEALAGAGNTSFELGWHAGKWLLPPGGNVLDALQLLERHATVAETYRPERWVWRALALHLAGRTQQAQELLDSASVTADRLGKAERRVFDTMVVRLAHAANDAERLARLCPTRPDARSTAASTFIACAETHLSRSRIDVALAYVESCPARREDVRSYLEGRIALARGDLPKAIRLLEPVRSSVRVSQAALLGALGRAYVASNKLKQGIALLRNAVVAAGHGPHARIALATGLIAAGHDTEAGTLLEQVMAGRPTDPDVIATLGTALIQLGRLTQARDVAAQLTELSPQSTAARLLSGQVALGQERLEEARQLFQSVLVVEPENAEALAMLGRIASRDGNATLARKHFARAIQLRPRDPELRLLVARAHAKTGDSKAALQHGRTAIALFRRQNRPHDGLMAMVTLGILLFADSADRPSRARGRKLLEEAVADPDPPALALLSLGRGAIADGQSSRALAYLRRAVEIDPLLPAAQLELGLALKKLRRTKEANAALRAYLELRPDAPNASRVKQLIAR